MFCVPRSLRDGPGIIMTPARASPQDSRWGGEVCGSKGLVCGTLLSSVQLNTIFIFRLHLLTFVSFRFVSQLAFYVWRVCFVLGKKIVASFREAVHVDKTLKSGSHRRRNLTNKSRDK